MSDSSGMTLTSDDLFRFESLFLFLTSVRISVGSDPIVGGISTVSVSSVGVPLYAFFRDAAIFWLLIDPFLSPSPLKTKRGSRSRRSKCLKSLTLASQVSETSF